MMIPFDILWPKYGIVPYGVLHCGANTGQEGEVYQKHGVKEVVWIEAVPPVFEQLQKNVASYPGQTCLLACIGEEEGKEVEFHISNNESQSSSYLELLHHKKIHPDVHYVSHFKTKIRRLDKMFTKFPGGDWFLNIDIQGSELQAFRGMGDLLHDFKWIYSEVNFKECYKGGALVEELDEYLATFGFVRVETGPVVSESWTDALYIKA